MKDRILIGACILIILVGAVVVYAVLNEPAFSNPEIHIDTVVTNQEVYRSNERMEIIIRISSSAPTNNFSLEVEGIVDTSRRTRLNEVRTVTLQQGANEVRINYTLPVCSRCAGLPAGNYSFNVSLCRNNTTFSTATHHVAIR